MKQNCWEFNNCGRGPGGEKTAESGVCEVVANTTYSGINSGLDAGRYCWKATNCSNPCDFVKLVQQEEGVNFVE